MPATDPVTPVPELPRIVIPESPSGARYALLSALHGAGQLADEALYAAERGLLSEMRYANRKQAMLLNNLMLAVADVIDRLARSEALARTRLDQPTQRPAPAPALALDTQSILPVGMPMRVMGWVPDTDVLLAKTEREHWLYFRTVDLPAVMSKKGG